MPPGDLDVPIVGHASAMRNRGGAFLMDSGGDMTKLLIISNMVHIHDCSRLWLGVLRKKVERLYIINLYHVESYLKTRNVLMVYLCLSMNH